VLPEEGAAVVAEVAPWDAVWAAALGSPCDYSHMVSRALVQTVLKMENNMRFGGHNMGKAPQCCWTLS
jgi:hypothetical protein